MINYRDKFARKKLLNVFYSFMRNIRKLTKETSLKWSNVSYITLINTFAATVVEFTVHCQTRLQSKFKGMVDSCLFLTIIWDSNLCSIFQIVKGT